MAKNEKESLYGETLNLPKTDFPMRGNLAKNEPQYLKFWDDLDIHHKVNEKNKDNPTFILHDGPPYANGHLHLGHTLNKVLKDMINKSKSLQGFQTPYVPGWDTHGLPIELKAIERLGLDAKDNDPIAFRDACRDYALSFVDIQRDEFKRLGVRGDWENPYLTLKPEFEAEEVGVFGTMAKKGYIYKGVKVIHWCPHDQTALAEAEIEYGEEVSPSIYVRLKITDAKGLFDETDAYFVIWTTTPWTLPANRAVCVHPEFTYQLLQFGNDKYILAKELVQSVIEACHLPEDYQVLKEWVGADLEYVRYQTPFKEESITVLGTHVTLEAGTGCVHTAPGHGQDDFAVGKAYHLEILSPIDDAGVLTDETGQFEGLSTTDANPVICQVLRDRGDLLGESKIHHQYPHCWRCKTPVLFRATDQWFASVDGFREEALKAIDEDIQFIPEWGKERIYNMIRDRGDWCISRQRIWGVPIPAFYCKDCGEIIINDESIAHVQDLFRKEGANAWYAHDEKELLPEGYRCPKCGGNHFRKETDTMDVWFDSGSTHQGVLRTRPELSWPADLYLEGSDQHRGWFNSSLCTSVAINGKAPYRGLLTHGFLVDEQGRKMSKSLGNGVDPQEVINKQGADILRLWVSSADYRGDVSVSDNIMKQTGESYRKIRNTLRYLLGSLFDFDPSQDAVAVEDMTALDRWALMRLKEVVDGSKEAYNKYEFHVVYRMVHNFCTADLSAFYLNIIKDRLYANEKKGVNRRAAQTVLFELAKALGVILSPILTFTTEEFFKYLPLENKPESVQLMDWPEVIDAKVDDAFKAKWDLLIALRDEVSKPLEEARRDKTIGNSLDAKLLIGMQGLDDVREALADLDMTLADYLLVSQAEVREGSVDGWASEEIPGLTVQVLMAEGNKCPRCWKYVTELTDDGEAEVCHRCAAVLEADQASI